MWVQLLFWFAAGRKLSFPFLFFCVCATLSPSEIQLLEFVNPTSEKMTRREKQSCLPISELGKHLHFSDSDNKSNKERNPLMNSSVASLHPAHLMLKWNTFLQAQSSHKLNNEYLVQQSSYPSWGFQQLEQHFWGEDLYERRLRSARVQQALLFSQMTGGVMALCRILAALLHAEKKRQADSMLFMLRTFWERVGLCFYLPL